MIRIPGRRRALTLVELLVVVAIIGVLIALLLPAVQYARAAARKASCKSNLKQIGLALANYHDSAGVYPPGYIAVFDVTGRFEAGPGWAWGSMLTPFLERGETFNSLNFDLYVEEAENWTARLRTIGTFVCVDDRMPATWWASQDQIKLNPFTGGIVTYHYPIAEVAGANYVGVYGTSEPGPDGDGVFFRNSKISSRDVLDGLAATTFVGERSVTLNSGRGYATWVGAPYRATLVSYGGGDPDAPDAYWFELPCGMVLGHSGEGHGPGDRNGDPNQFSSSHGNGAFFLFGDGSARWLDSSMDYRLYKGLTTRAGGETNSSAAF